MSFLSKENRIVFSQGVYDAVLSRTFPVPPGVVLEARGGFALRIPDKVVIEEMIHLVFRGGETALADKGPFSIRIFAGASTRLNLVLHKQGSGWSSPARINTEIFLSEGACVNYYQIEESGILGEWSTENIFHLKKHSSLDYFVFAAGDGSSLTKTSVDFTEEHGFFSAKGLSVLKNDSKASHELSVHHRVPHCISRQYYKNILAGEARSEFISLVKVVQGASKSDSQQINRNLLLSDAAQAYARPQLEIFTDDVVATHGSATGQLEDQELFYLQSRGLSKKNARLVLIDGFAGEMIAEIHEKGLKDHLESVIHQGVALVAGEAGS